jgi:hypothetical protein
MDKELNLFRQLVLLIFEKHKGAYEDPPASVRAILDHIANKYVRFADGAALENALPTDDHPTSDFKEVMRFLYLRPIQTGTPTIPVLSLKANFARSLPEVRIRVALFLLDEIGEIRCQGYRYEAPEGPGDGRHDYYHVQPIRVLYRDRPGFQLPTPPWFLDSHPTWPVDARDPVSLMISLLVSLYGLDFRNEILAYPMASVLKRHMSLTPCLNLQPASLWKVTCAGNEFHYATWFSKDAFEKFCAKVHTPRFKKEPLAISDYRAQPQEHQLIC